MTDPSPCAPWRSLIADLGAALRHAGHAALPPISGLSPAIVARAVYRNALEREPWGPWVHVAQPHLPEGGIPAWILGMAADGWLFVEGPDAAALAAALLREAAGRRTRVLWQGGGPPQALAEDERAQALHLDHLHGVATDPALAPARRALLAHGRAAGQVHIVGEPGTGKVSLARWAHATLDDRPLSWLRPGHGQLHPGEWALVEEPAELSSDQRQALARALAAADPPEAVRRSPAGPARPRHPALRAILGQSAPLAGVLHELLRVAPTPLSVLITGEPGTGKESLAAAVHAVSGRAGPFVAVDVGALSEDLAESELFGHKRGASPGADRARPGAFRAAHGGTLFLDELGNLPARLQVKLLRVLQERQVQPVGEDAPVPVDVRVIAATNADLYAMVQRGAFRADLLSRLDAVTLQLPPLRERLDDLDALAQGLLAGRTHGIPWCTEEARQILRAHRWPGNVRELSNVLRYADAVCPPGQPIGAEHLGPLSPRVRRRVPTLVVSSGGSTEGWGLERRLVQALTASTLTVPPVRDRGEASIRAVILDGLGGRPIEPAALDLLARQPWWGNLPELSALLAALRALPPGPIDRGALIAPLPHLLDPAARAPMHVVLLPALDEDGRLTGLMREVHAGAALLGRVRDVRELQGSDPRMRAAWAAIRAVVGDTTVSAVDLSLIPQLSRAQALVARDEEGLVVIALPGAGGRLLAGGLAGAGLRTCAVDRPVSLGTAGEIAVIGRADELVLSVYVFLGDVALAEHGPTAAARAAAARHALDVTQDSRGLPAPAPEPRDSPSLRVWTVTPEERAALTELLGTYESGQIKPHVLSALAGWRADPALRRLTRYLEEAPRLSQYLTRLVEHADNQPLRADLAARLLALPDVDLRLELLPKGLRDAVLAEGRGA